ncbi:hypothetical protein HY634_00850 [Candidatus Uhrbacteria bacterium]|nr:hypothetical protein [Candidatus Uhrbacteria bacterium]
MTRRTVDGIATGRFAALAMTVLVGCASSGLEQRVAQLEQELKAARATAPARAITADEAVEMGDAIAAASPPTYVVFVDERPEHCDGALCWSVENGHRNPVLLTIDGQPATVVGPMGPMLPPGSRGYVRLTTPRRVQVSYDVYDTISMGDASPRMPLPTVLYRCRLEADVGGAADAYWGGHATHLDHSFCY